MEQLVQGTIAHELCDYAEELGLVADAKDLDDVVEPGFVKHLGLLQQTFPLSETQQVTVNIYPQTAIKIPQILTVFYWREVRESHEVNKPPRLPDIFKMTLLLQDFEQ